MALAKSIPAVAGNLLERIDQWILLRHPRIWQTRLHVVLMLAALFYPILIVLGLVLFRPFLQSLVHGNVGGVWLDSRFPAAPSSQAINTGLLWTFVYDARDKVAIATCLAVVMLLLLTVIPSILLLRSQARYSIELANGRRTVVAGFIEWISYLLASMMFAGVAWVFLWLVQPAASQNTSVLRIKTQSAQAAQSLWEGLPETHPWKESISPDIPFFQTWEGGRAFAVLTEADPEAHYFARRGPSQFIAPDTLGDIISISQSISPALTTITFTWQVNSALTPIERQYIDDIRALAYARGLDFFTPEPPAFFADGDAAARPIVMTLMNGFFRFWFWWIVGANALLLYLRPRASRGTIVGAIILFVLLYPIAGLMGAFLGPAVGSLIPSSLAPENTRFSASSTTLPAAIATLYALASVLLALFGRLQKSWIKFGVVLFPFALAHLPHHALFWMNRSLFSTSIEDPLVAQQQVERMMQVSEYFNIATAAMPFVIVPFFLIWDWALTRLNSLPKPS